MWHGKSRFWKHFCSPNPPVKFGQVDKCIIKKLFARYLLLSCLDFNHLYKSQDAVKKSVERHDSWELQSCWISYKDFPQLLQFQGILSEIRLSEGQSGSLACQFEKA